jgi:hypothetical protein
MGQEVRFVETLQVEQFPQDRSEAGVSQLLLFRLRQMPQTQDLPPGTPESSDCLEVNSYPEDRYSNIHFTSPSLRYRPYGSLPERIVLMHNQEECTFGFGHKCTLTMIAAVLRTAAPHPEFWQAIHRIQGKSVVLD